MTAIGDIGALVHIVDDEESIRLSLEFLLGAAGYRVACWSNGEDFLNGADKAVPASVLLDIRMPGMDGLEVLEQMSQRGFDFPVIILTGHADVGLAVRGMKGGAADFMEKPFDRERLLRSIAATSKRLAERHGLREEQAQARAQLARLTEREREVLDGLACGYPNKTVAFDLGISSRTVEILRANFIAKLGVASFTDAVRIAFKGGLGSEKAWRENYGIDQAEEWLEDTSASGSSEVDNSGELIRLSNQLSNRRAFEMILEHEYRTASMAMDSLCIAFCDIDRCGAINEAHGNDAGDRVIQSVARMMQRISNQNSHVACHGGQEFALLFRGTTADQARRKLDDALQEFARRKLIDRETGMTIGRVTFSGGVADVFAYADPGAAIKAAEEALSQAKEEGRHRILMASKPERALRS